MFMLKIYRESQDNVIRGNVAPEFPKGIQRVKAAARRSGEGESWGVSQPGENTKPSYSSRYMRRQVSDLHTNVATVFHEA